MENGSRLASSSSTSSVSSVSMLEVKAETRLVLQAFLHRTACIPLKDRPGRVGGAYRDHNKHRHLPRGREGWDSQAEELSSGDDKKNGFMGFIKQLPRKNIRSPKGPPRRKNTVHRDQEDELASPQTSTDEDEQDKKTKLSTKKIKRRLSKFFKKKLDKDKEKEKEKDKDKDKQKEPARPPPPSRPNSLPLDPPADPLTPPLVISPNHPPGFYNDVAERLEQIAYRSGSISNIKRHTIKRPSPEPPPLEPPPRLPSPVYDKETVVQRLVDIIIQEGDAINTKIESDPFLRSSLSRLSYASFSRLLDVVSSDPGSCDVPAPPPDASPTLQRMAVSMEVSRRIVTATGAQRMQGYAECYMENFAPWVKRQGGWENVMDLEDEYD